MDKITDSSKSQIYIERKARAKKALYFLITLVAISIILTCFNNFILSNLYVSLPILTVVLPIMLAYIFKDKIFPKAKNSENSLFSDQGKAHLAKESSSPSVPTSSTTPSSSSPVPTSSTAPSSSSPVPTSSTAPSSSSPVPTSSTTPSSSSPVPASSTAPSSSSPVPLDVAPIESATYREDAVSVQYFTKPLRLDDPENWGNNYNYIYVRVHAESETSLESWINHLNTRDTSKKLAVFKHSLYPNFCYITLKDEFNARENVVSILHSYGITNIQPETTQHSVIGPSPDFFPLVSVNLATTNDPNLCIITCRSISCGIIWQHEVDKRSNKKLQIVRSQTSGKKIESINNSTYYVSKASDQPGTLIDVLTKYNVTISDTHAYLFPQVTIKLLSSKSEKDTYKVTAHSPKDLRVWIDVVCGLQSGGLYFHCHLFAIKTNSWAFEHDRTSTKKTLAEILHFIPSERISFEKVSSTGASSATSIIDSL